jgi:kynurenine formamidase
MTGSTRSAPTFAELRERTDGAPSGSSWGVFGERDEFGSANFLSSAAVIAAAHAVREGRVFGLDHTVDTFSPPAAPHRHAARHRVIEYRPDHLDDCLDSFFLQSSSHIDGLRHVAHHEHGFYNGLLAGDVAGHGTTERQPPTLGVQRWAESGLVGRGVLVDVARQRTLDHEASEPIAIELLELTLERQGTELQRGDILLVRTDWPAYYRRWAAAGGTAELHSAGLQQSEEMLAWIWDHGLAAVAADNFALEAYPAADDSPFENLEGGVVVDRLMHPALIALLGLVVGELWDLEALAADCAADGVYESLLVAKPLNLTGGVGSPANAVAIK